MSKNRTLSGYATKEGCDTIYFNSLSELSKKIYGNEKTSKIRSETAEKYKPMGWSIVIKLKI